MTQDIHPMLTVTLLYFVVCVWREVWVIWHKQNTTEQMVYMDQETFLDRTEAMLDRRGQGPGPVGYHYFLPGLHLPSQL